MNCDFCKTPLTNRELTHGRAILFSMTCRKCYEEHLAECEDCNEGTLLKEFDNTKSYSWSELCDMTEICASCGKEVD